MSQYISRITCITLYVDTRHVTYVDTRHVYPLSEAYNIYNDAILSSDTRDVYQHMSRDVYQHTSRDVYQHVDVWNANELYVVTYIVMQFTR